MLIAAVLPFLNIPARDLPGTYAIVLGNDKRVGAEGEDLRDKLLLGERPTVMRDHCTHLVGHTVLRVFAIDHDPVRLTRARNTLT